VGHWDRSRLEQVLLNLLTNAMKYGEGRPVRGRVEQDDGLVRLEVQDEGIGISSEDQERIFERFERATPARHHYEGLGLGLYLTRQIVLAHGGSIRVRSAPGQGSTFTVELPREPKAEGARPRAVGR
jgi:two-component system, LuxR family, sensor kinase FixL